MGFGGELRFGDFVFGLVLASDDPLDPLGRATAGLQSGPGARLFYLDDTPENGVLGSGSSPNAQTADGVGSFVIADAVHGTYEVRRQGYRFGDFSVAGIQQEIVVVPVVGEPPVN